MAFMSPCPIKATLGSQDPAASPLPHHPCPRAEKGSKVDFLSCQKHLLVWRLAKGVGPCVCWVQGAFAC